MALLPSPADVKAMNRLDETTRAAGIYAQISKVLAHPPALKEIPGHRDNVSGYFVSSYAEGTVPKSLRNTVVNAAEGDGWTVTWTLRNKKHGGAFELWVRPA